MADDEKLNTLNLTNICGGAAAEIFERELERVLKNIADINTVAEAKRSITLEFAFHPFESRTGATVHLSCKSKLVSMPVYKGNVFLGRKDGKVIGLPEDPRQEKLFKPSEEDDDEEKPSKEWRQ